MTRFNRREFLKTSAGLPVALAALPACGATSDPDEAFVMTVRGRLPIDKMGLTFSHEHVVTDFLGAEKLAQPRYERDVAVDVILPELKALKARGCSTLVECTPNYIGRDVKLLRRLSSESGLNVLTNTGYYGAVGNKYLPRHAFDETADAIAKRWLNEWRSGIDGTDVKPGFIKLGVDQGPLPPVHEKLVRAAARVHRQSGLTICIHTGDGEAACDELRILEDEGIAPRAYVWVHAQNGDQTTQVELAKRGAWLSLDGYSLAAGNPERYVTMLIALQEANCLDRVLISHDDGWAVEGEQPHGAGLKLFGNGNPRPYTSLFTRWLPDLQNAGFTTAEIDQLTRANPAKAFAVQVRSA